MSEPESAELTDSPGIPGSSPTRDALPAPGPSATSGTEAATSDAAAPPRTGAGRWITGLLGVATAALAGFAVCRLVGLDWFTPLAQLVSFTPYLVPAGAVLGVVGLVARRWRTGLVAVLVVVALAVVVGPRAYGGDSPAPARGIPLRVMTANLYHGGSAAALVGRVRAERPDVLSLQEVTEEALAELTASGLDEVLPYRAARPHPGAAGTALYGRTPFTGATTVDRRTRFDMVRASTVHKGVTLHLVAAHPSPPVPVGDATRDWYAELGMLPRPDPDDGAVTVLAGDFNATLDHSGLRAVLDTGYLDAADAAGAGLTPTWRAGWVPPVTIDHVLAEQGVGVRAVRVYPVAGSDHRTLVADLVLRGGAAL